MTTKAIADYTGREFIITRTFDAPRELVFQAWTDPAHLAQWWGPRGFTNPVCEWDVRVGGKIYDVMRAPNGMDFPMGGEFREITPPERLVFMCGALNEKGEMMFEFLHTAVFTDQKGKTLLTLNSRVLRVTAEANKYIGGFEAGMTSSLEKLTELLAPKTEPLVIERLIDAPTAMVWEALTDPEKISRWSFEMKEFRAEAGFKFELLAEKDGVKYVHHCQVTEAVPNKKLAYTWRYEGYEGDSLVAFELSPEGNKTRLKLTHAGLETFPQIPAFTRTNFMAGWTHISSALGEFVQKDTASREILISRVVDAPRELVWEAMTKPEHVVQWWGPRGFTSTTEIMDVRPGGEWKHVMQGPDGTKFPNHSVFLEVARPERIVFAHGGHREGGPSVSMLSTWTFEVVEPGKTRVTIRMVFPSAANRDFVVKEFGAIEGGKQTLERLDEFMAKNPAVAAARAKPSAPDDRAVVITRTFDTPRELVWRAWTDPKQMAQWWGPRGFTNPVCEMDVQPGGTWRVVMRSPEGEEFPLKSTFVKVEPPERLVLVMDCSEHPVEWHDLVNPNRDKSQKPRLDCVQIITFEDLGGKTKLTIRTELETSAIRDAMVKMGMHEGWSGSLDRLAQCLAQTA